MGELIPSRVNSDNSSVVTAFCSGQDLVVVRRTRIDFFNKSPPYKLMHQIDTLTQNILSAAYLGGKNAIIYTELHHVQDRTPNLYLVGRNLTDRPIWTARDRENRDYQIPIYVFNTSVRRLMNPVLGTTFKITEPLDNMINPVVLDHGTVIGCRTFRINHEEGVPVMAHYKNKKVKIQRDIQIPGRVCYFIVKVDESTVVLFARGMLHVLDLASETVTHNIKLSIDTCCAYAMGKDKLFIIGTDGPATKYGLLTGFLTEDGFKEVLYQTKQFRCQPFPRCTFVPVNEETLFVVLPNYDTVLFRINEIVSIEGCLNPYFSEKIRSRYLLTHYLTDNFQDISIYRDITRSRTKIESKTPLSSVVKQDIFNFGDWSLLGIDRGIYLFDPETDQVATYSHEAITPIDVHSHEMIGWFMVSGNQILLEGSLVYTGEQEIDTSMASSKNKTLVFGVGEKLAIFENGSVTVSSFPIKGVHITCVMGSSVLVARDGNSIIQLVLGPDSYEERNHYQLTSLPVAMVEYNYRYFAVSCISCDLCMFDLSIPAPVAKVKAAVPFTKLITHADVLTGFGEDVSFFIDYCEITKQLVPVRIEGSQHCTKMCDFQSSLVFQKVDGEPLSVYQRGPAIRTTKVNDVSPLLVKILDLGLGDTRVLLVYNRNVTLINPRTRKIDTTKLRKITSAFLIELRNGTNVVIAHLYKQDRFMIVPLLIDRQGRITKGKGDSSMDGPFAFTYSKTTHCMLVTSQGDAYEINVRPDTTIAAEKVEEDVAFAYQDGSRFKCVPNGSEFGGLNDDFTHTVKPATMTMINADFWINRSYPLLIRSGEDPQNYRFRGTEEYRYQFPPNASIVDVVNLQPNGWNPADGTTEVCMIRFLDNTELYYTAKALYDCLE